MLNRSNNLYECLPWLLLPVLQDRMLAYLQKHVVLQTPFPARRWPSGIFCASLATACISGSPKVVATTTANVTSSGACKYSSQLLSPSIFQVSSCPTELKHREFHCTSGAMLSKTESNSATKSPGHSHKPSQACCKLIACLARFTFPGALITYSLVGFDTLIRGSNSLNCR